MNAWQAGVLAALARKGMHKKELATELDVTPATISRWLSGRLTPSMVARIAVEHVLLVPREDWPSPAQEAAEKSGAASSV